MTSIDNKCYNKCIAKCNENKKLLEEQKQSCINNGCDFLNPTSKDEAFKIIIDIINEDDEKCDQLIEKNNSEVKQYITNKEEQKLFIQIHELKTEIEKYYSNKIDLNKLLNSELIKEKFKNSENLKVFLKEIIKILQLTLLNIKKEYIPEPIININTIIDTIEITQINNKLDTLINNLYYLIILRKLFINQKNLEPNTDNFYINNILSIIIKDINNYQKKYKNKQDLIKLYNYLNDLYLIIQNNNNLRIIIQKILQLEYDIDFIKFYKTEDIKNIYISNNIKPSIFDIMKDFLEKTETKIENKLSNFNYKNYKECCFLSSILQFLYNYIPYKQYILNINFKNIDKIKLILNYFLNDDTKIDKIDDLSDNKNFLKTNINFNEFDNQSFQENLINPLNINNINYFNNCYRPLLIMYIIKYLFNVMDKEQTETSKNLITYKYIPILRVLLIDENDYKEKITNYLIIDKTTINIELTQEDSSEYMFKILQKTFYDFNKDFIEKECSKIFKTSDLEIKLLNTIDKETNIQLNLFDYLSNLINANERITDNNKQTILSNLHTTPFTTEQVFLNNILKNYFKDENYDYNYDGVIQGTLTKKYSIKYNTNLNNIILVLNCNDNLSGLKIDANIFIDKIIDLKDYTNIKNNIKFKLKSVIIHNGESLNSGHYYIYINDIDDNMYNYNDMVNNRERLNTTITKINNKDYYDFKLSNNLTAYVLHYERINKTIETK